MAVPSVRPPASASPKPVPLPIPNPNPLCTSLARASGRTRSAPLAARLRGVPRAAFTGYGHGDTPKRSGDVASPQYISTMESVNSRPMPDYADDQADSGITSPMFHCAGFNTPKKKPSLPHCCASYTPECAEQLKPKVGMAFDDVDSWRRSTRHMHIKSDSRSVLGSRSWRTRITVRCMCFCFCETRPERVDAQE